METPTHDAGCVCKACCDARVGKKNEPRTAKFARWAEEQKVKADEQQAKKYERQAEKQDKRAMKMSKKIGRGGRRSAKASQTAMSLHEAADRKRQSQAPSAAVSAPDNPIEQLKKLGELRDAGVLSHQEFEGKKAELLDRL